MIKIILQSLITVIPLVMNTICYYSISYPHVSHEDIEENGSLNIANTQSLDIMLASTTHLLSFPTKQDVL